MTDNESFDVISGLNCCKNNEEYDIDKFCGDCEFASYGKDCKIMLLDKSIDLINRQKAEIERHREHIELLDIEHEAIQNKAIKEFAERFEKEAENVGIDREGDFLYSDSDNTAFEIYNTVAEWCKEVANTILKEMVGDTK